MFNDLFWSLYWIDILSSIGRNTIGAAMLGLFGAFFVALILDHKQSGPRLSSCLLGFFPVFVITIAFCFIPSKDTMYMMLGVRGTEHFVNSEVGKKLGDLVNKQIDDYLKKFNKE